MAGAILLSKIPDFPTFVYDFRADVLLLAALIRMTETPQGVKFAVRVVARASRSEIAGEFEGALRIRLAAPPVAGAANRELIRVLAKELKLAQHAVQIISGSGSKNKTIRLSNASPEVLMRLRNLS